MYALNPIGAIACYLHLTSQSSEAYEKLILPKVVLLRGILTFLMLVCFLLFSEVLIAILLALLGYFYALFSICALTISMEHLLPKRAGLFDALVNWARFVGCLLDRHC